ncbi:MAG: hypothetical protein FJW23_05560 [Acidimicrobiia bacterium]|nr:hypothetical protein [Acidimicrobiia bacterium]
MGVAAAVPAAAQAPAGEVTVRGFADLGFVSFQARDSFEALFGSSSAPAAGGGADVLMPRGLFAQVRISRVSRTGQRVFVFGGQAFPLDISETLTISPLQIGGGLRFARPAWRVVPFAGGGLGWHRITEEAGFSDESEIVQETVTGYYLAGGVEAKIWKWIGAAGEVEWSSVPDGLGQDALTVGAAFGETNLGGFTVRAKVLVGSW